MSNRPKRKRHSDLSGAKRHVKNDNDKPIIDIIREEIAAAPRTLTMQEVVDRADKINSRSMERIANQKASLDRVMGVLKTAQDNCTCGAVEKAVERGQAKALVKGGD